MPDPQPLPAPQEAERALPSRLQALAFAAKVRLFQSRRLVTDLTNRLQRQTPNTSTVSVGWKTAAELRTPLWREMSPAEFPLTAGKIHNLRVSAKTFDGVELAPGEVLSFWRQLGRAVKRRGYVAGRELREGCMVPSVGGGLCQLSGALYAAAIDAGLTIVERHAHSRIVPGSMAEQARDATVFWNYVDLRLASDRHWRLRVRLTETDLLVAIDFAGAEAQTKTKPAPDRTAPATDLPREGVSGDCLTCNMTSCFRHPGAIAEHGPSLGHSSFLLDARWPEFDAWVAGHAREGDRFLTPMDGQRWQKANYAWRATEGQYQVKHATLTTLRKSLKMRSIPAQGAVRQRALLEGDEALARAFASRLHPECRHVVIAQICCPSSGATGS